MTPLDTDVAHDVVLAPPIGGGVACADRDGDTNYAAFVELVGQIAPIDIEPAALSRASSLAGDLMLDSISLISLMALTEAHFGVALSEHAEDVANLRTLGDALDLLARLQAAGA
jgi:acyl carrier protein